MPWYYPGYPSTPGDADINWVSAEMDSDGNIARLSDCDGDGVPTQSENSTHFVENIDSAHNCWLINRLAMSMYTMTNTTWVEKDAIIVHSEGGEDRFFDFDNNTGNGLQFGVADLTTADKPIVYGDCYYCADGLYYNGTKNGHRIFDDNGYEAGRVQLYGGVFETWGCMDNDGDIVYLPTGNSGNPTHIIGTHIIRFAGFFSNDTYGRVQEILLSCSTRTGLSLVDSNDTIGYTKIINENIRQALNFSTASGSDTYIDQIELREAFSGYGEFFYFGEGQVQQGALTNSDELASLTSTSIIDGYSQSNQQLNIWFQERSTYTLKVVNTSGTNLQDVSVLLKSNLSVFGRTEDNEDFTRVIFSGETNTSGEIAQQTIVKKHYYPGATPNIISYSDYSLDLRKYGFKLYQFPRVFGYGINSGINETVVLEVDTFIDQSYSTVNAYSGITIDFITKKITLTEEHTIQELYDWVSLQCTDNSNVDSINYLPLTTSDGVTFILDNIWKIYNKEFLNTGTQIIEFHNNTRYVPLRVTGCINGSRYYINSGSNVYYYGEIDISGNISKTWLWSIDTPLTITIRLKGYKPFKVTATINNAGLNLPVTQIIDTNFTL